MVRTVVRHRVRLGAMLFLLALLAIAAFSGRPPIDIVAVTTTPSPRGTERPSPSVAPSVDELPAPYDTHLGFKVWTNASDPWVSVARTWAGHPESIGKALDFGFGRCASEGCVPSAVSVSVATVGEGSVVVDWTYEECPNANDRAYATTCAIWSTMHRGTPVVIEGTTTDELVAAWVERFGAVEPQSVFIAGARWVIVDRKSVIAGFTANGDQLLAITSQAAPGLSLMAREARFRKFVAAIRFDELRAPGSAPPGSGVVRDLELTLSADWSIAQRPSSLDIWEATGGLFSISMRITALGPGERIAIRRPVGDRRNADILVSGLTLDELVARIDAAVGDGIRTDTAIGGEPGYRWRLPQRWYVGPLVALAVVEWKGMFYVFEEHLPLDGPPGRSFEDLLGGVTLR